MTAAPRVVVSDARRTDELDRYLARVVADPESEEARVDFLGAATRIYDGLTPEQKERVEVAYRPARRRGGLEELRKLRDALRGLEP